MKNIQKIRDQLHQLKPMTFKDLKDDMSNLDDILDEYRVIYKATKGLVNLEGQSVQEALVTHPSEFHFFSTCTANLRAFLDYFDALIRSKRSEKYLQIRSGNSRDLNHAAINQMIDSNADIFDLFSRYLKVKSVHDIYLSRVDAYKQRGYTLNNLMKAFEMESLGVIL